MQTLTTAWTSGGVERTLTTTRNDGESTADFITRHKAAEDVAFEVWPKDN